MKTLTLGFATIVVLGTLTLGMSANIDTQLSEISNASQADRVELVNNLKTELQDMSPEDRHEVLSQVRFKMGKQMHAQMRERSQHANADSAMQIQAMEHSAQRRMDAGIEMNEGAMSNHVQSTSVEGETSLSMFSRR